MKTLLLAAICTGANLTYYGAEHATDPQHPQFSEIERLWNEAKPSLAFYEGPNRPLPASRDEVISQAGESGFVRYLAARDHIPFATLEPNPMDEVAHVLKSYPLEQVALFYTLREASRLRERQGMGEQQITARIDQMLSRMPKVGSADNPFRTSADVAAAYAKYWKSPAQWWQAPKDWFDPLKPSSATGGIFTNEINALSSSYRDVHMVGALSAATTKGKVFAVVGRNHVLAQAVPLRCALQGKP